MAAISLRVRQEVRNVAVLAACIIGSANDCNSDETLLPLRSRCEEILDQGVLLFNIRGETLGDIVSAIFEYWFMNSLMSVSEQQQVWYADSSAYDEEYRSDPLRLHVPRKVYVNPRFRVKTFCYAFKVGFGVQ